jgi:hypothetical protein
MMTGAGVLVLGVAATATTAVVGILDWVTTAVLWVIIGAGMAMIVTPTGKVLRRSVAPGALPEVFAAQFSLSHLAWLLTYPIAGWVGTEAGFPITWTILAVLAVSSAASAWILWPRHDVVALPTPAPIAIRYAILGESTLAAGQCACVRTV